MPVEVTPEREQEAGSCCVEPAEQPSADQIPVELSPAVHAFLKALASSTRQRIMLLFARGAELSVGQVADLAGLAQPRASVYLAELKRGGMLTSRKDGKVVLYRGDRATTAHLLNELQTYLRYCC
ncbi:ArsR/SmtB family transcription factor [Nonomuraea typhae]|uniref:ArsR/SmtB family transcription factor n=1 Tax=Nonomuraea typhae TaxID=2603600 RepID=A0ABW7YVY9_9ACTN